MKLQYNKEQLTTRTIHEYLTKQYSRIKGLTSMRSCKIRFTKTSWNSHAWKIPDKNAMISWPHRDRKHVLGTCTGIWIIFAIPTNGIVSKRTVICYENYVKLDICGYKVRENAKTLSKNRRTCCPKWGLRLYIYRKSRSERFRETINLDRDGKTQI